MLAFDVLARDPLDSEAISALEAINRAAKSGAPDSTLYHQYFDTLAHVYGKKHNEYSDAAQQIAFRAINNFLRRLLEEHNEQLFDSAQPVLPVLLSYLRPAGFEVDGRPPADPTSNEVRAAHTLHDFFLAAPKLVEHALKQDGLGNSRPDVRHASLLFLEVCLKTDNGLKFKPLTPTVTRLLNDTDAGVRNAATAILVAFFGSASEYAKADLVREMKRQRIRDPDQVLMGIGLTREVLDATETPSSSKESTDSNTASSGGPDGAAAVAAAALRKKASPSASNDGSQSSSAPLIHEIIVNPLYKLQPIKAEDVPTVADFKAIIESMKPLFKEKELDTNWEAREKAINRLRALVRGNILDYPGDIVWALKYLAHEIKAGLYSLRTTLCSNTLHLVKDCTQLLKSYFDAVIDPYMQFLCEVVSSTKKITANLAYITTCSLILNTSMSTKVISYTHNFVSDQLPGARVAAFKWYHIMFVCHSPDIRFMIENTKTVDVILGDLKRGLADAQAPVREAARSVFWLFAACWPQKAEQLGTSLDPQAKKQLLRSQPKELLESYDHNFELHVSNKPAQGQTSRPARSRPVSRATSIKSQQQSAHVQATVPKQPQARTPTLTAQQRPRSAMRAQSACSEPLPPKKILTAQAHVPDIIRRVSRALNDPKPRFDQVLEPHPADLNSAPVQLGGIVAPNAHVASALETASKLIDEMPLEPTPTPGQLETIENEPTKDVPMDSSGFQKAVPSQKDLDDPKKTPNGDSNPGSEPKAQTVPSDGEADDCQPQAEPKAPQSDVNMGEDEEKPTEGFQTGMLIETLVASAREAVSEALQEKAGSTADFDPGKFDKDIKITNASEFKEALRSELNSMPTMDISIEAIADKTAKKMQPKFDEYVQMYPESKEAIMEAAKLVESAARRKEQEDEKEGSEGGDANHASGNEDTITMKNAVDEVVKQMDTDTEKTSSRLNSLGDLLDSDDVDTMTMGVNVLSYVLRGKRPPGEALKGLGTLSIPPPDLIGKALNYLFDQAMDHNPQVKELLEKFASADLVAITLSYVGHALVMYVAVHLLPAEALVLTVQVIQPLLNIGAIIDTLFEIANADDVSEAALLALGGLLTGFDRIPMSPVLRDKAKAALEVIYRLGDLSFDVTAFLADWIGFDSDSDDSTDSDDDSDDEKIAAKHARKFERHMAERAPSAVAAAVAAIALEKTEPGITASIAQLRLEESTKATGDKREEQKGDREEEEEEEEDANMKPYSDAKLKENGEQDPPEESQSETHEKDAIFAEPISSLHPVSISYMPGAQSSKAVRRFKFYNASALDPPNQTGDEVEHIRLVFSPVPRSRGDCLQLFEKLANQLETFEINKHGLVQLISLTRGSVDANSARVIGGEEPDENAMTFKLWRDLPQLQDRVARASLVFCQRRGVQEDMLNLGLILVRTVLECGGFNTQVDQLRVLECLCTISGHELADTSEYTQLTKTRDALLERNIKTERFIEDLINVFQTGSTSARLFALKTIRQVVAKTTTISPQLQDAVRAAITDDNVQVRKQAYPILLNIHMQSESAARVIKEQLTQGQQRLFEYYSSAE